MISIVIVFWRKASYVQSLKINVSLALADGLCCAWFGISHLGAGKGVQRYGLALSNGPN
jgi:hypothetical protein